MQISPIKSNFATKNNSTSFKSYTIIQIPKILYGETPKLNEVIKSFMDGLNTVYELKQRFGFLIDGTKPEMKKITAQYEYYGYKDFIEHMQTQVPGSVDWLERNLKIKTVKERSPQHYSFSIFTDDEYKKVKKATSFFNTLKDSLIIGSESTEMNLQDRDRNILLAFCNARRVELAEQRIAAAMKGTPINQHVVETFDDVVDIIYTILQTQKNNTQAKTLLAPHSARLFGKSR